MGAYNTLNLKSVYITERKYRSNGKKGTRKIRNEME